jgi:hypothetical protein
LTPHQNGCASTEEKARGIYRTYAVPQEPCSKSSGNRADPVIHFGWLLLLSKPERPQAIEDQREHEKRFSGQSSDDQC